MAISVQTIIENDLPPGPRGYNGSVGFTGSIGYTGSRGAQGIGSGQLLYVYDSASTSPTPAAQYFRMNNISTPSVTEIYLADNPYGTGTSVSTFLATLDDSTNPYKGFFVLKNADLTVSGGLAVYQLNSVTTNTGYSTLSVTYVSGPGGTITNNAFYSFDFSRSGNIGYIGSRGDVGYVGSVGIVTWTRITSNTTASINQQYLADTSGGPFTLTLPATPTVGNFMFVADGNDWSANNLTVARNGSLIEGGTDDVLMDVKGIQAIFVYNGATNGWQVNATLAKALTYPYYHTFGSTGVPTTGTDKTPWLNILDATNATSLYLLCKTAPSGGSFQVTIKYSTNTGGTWSTLGTVSVSSGNKSGSTTITTTPLAVGYVLRIDVDSVNGASDWTCTLRTVF